jgi:hypothetical protein
MPRTTSAFVLCALMLSVPSSGLFRVVADDATDSPGNEPTRTTIIHAHRPVQSIAKSLTDVMGRSNIRIATDVESNVVMLTGSQQEVENAANLLRALDLAPQMINIAVVIVVRNTATGDDDIHDELQLSTLNEMQVQLQFGQQVTVPESVQRVGSKTMARSYRRENVGTLVHATPRIVGNGIMLALTIEKSWIETPKTDEADSEAENLALPVSYNTEAETTLHLQHGQSQTFRAVVSRGRNDGRDVLITVSATTAQQQSAVRGTTTGKATSGRSRQGGAMPGQPSSGRGGGTAGSRSRTGAAQRRGFGGREILRPGDRSGSRGGFGGDFGRPGGRRDDTQSGRRTRPESEGETAPSEGPTSVPNEGTSASEEDSAKIHRLETQGRRYFHVLDRDTNGRVDREEWETSRRLKPMFEAAGIMVTSVSENEFVKQFVAATRHSEQQRQGSDE